MKRLILVLFTFGSTVNSCLRFAWAQSMSQPIGMGPNGPELIPHEHKHWLRSVPVKEIDFKVRQESDRLIVEIRSATWQIEGHGVACGGGEWTLSSFGGYRSAKGSQRIYEDTVPAGVKPKVYLMRDSGRTTEISW